MRPQFGVIIGIVVAGQALAQRQLLQGYEPPGKLVDVGRRKRDIHCSGNGKSDHHPDGRRWRVLHRLDSRTTESR
jgi:hypothetical protein